jgi:hypothetical protein
VEGQGVAHPSTVAGPSISGWENLRQIPYTADKGRAGVGSRYGYRSGKPMIPFLFNSPPAAVRRWRIASYTSTGSLDFVYT